MLLVARYGHPFDAIGRVARAALEFGRLAASPEGPDACARTLIATQGKRGAFLLLSGLSDAHPIEQQIADISLHEVGAVQFGVPDRLSVLG